MTTEGIGICGIGAVTGYGWGREALWDGLLSGKPAAEVVSGLGPDFTETGWVARVPEGGDHRDGPSRFARALRASAREAIEDAKDRGWQPGRRVGLLHGVVMGEVDLWQDFYANRGVKLRPRDYLAMLPSTPMSAFMQEYGFHGPAMNVSAMCASGNAGVLTAMSWLDAGIVDDVVLVATDISAIAENVLHFERLRVAVSDAEPLDACRPFQEGSRGFVFGEASVAFVLSNRAGRPYAAALGGAMSHDAYHVVSIDPEVEHVLGCMRDALANSGVSGSAVRYYNAHGPGTKACDRAETAVVDQLFPNASIFSVKPLVGHCQGASAALEIAVSALGYDRGVIPAPRPVAPADPRLLPGPVPVDGGITVKCSLGMGGHNSALVLAPPA